MKKRKFGRIPLFLGLGVLFGIAALALRLLATGELARWQARRMPQEALSSAAARPDASYALVLELARRLEADGRFREAGREYQRAAELRPTAREAWVGWGRSAYEAGDWKSATAVLGRAVEVWPGDAETRFAYAAVLGGSYRHRAARDQLREALRHDPRKAEAWQTLGDLEMALENPLGAVDAYGRVRKLDPKNRESQVRLGGALVAAGRWEDARRELEASLKEDPSDMNARYHLASALVSTGREEDRVQGLLEFSRVAAFTEDKGRVWVRLAEVSLKHGNAADAAQALEHAYDYNPYDVDALQALVRVYRQQKRLAEARRFEPELQRLQGLVARERQAQQRIGEGQDVPGNLLELGRVLMELRRPAEARAALQAAGAVGAPPAAVNQAVARLDRVVQQTRPLVGRLTPPQGP